MHSRQKKFLWLGLFPALASALLIPLGARAQEQGTEANEERDREALLDQIERIEERLSELKARAMQSDPPGTNPLASAQAQQMPAMGQPAGAPPPQQPGTQAGTPGGAEQTLQERIAELERRVGELESSTVLSEPETRVRRVEVWVDANGVEYDHEVPGSRRVFTYQRERVYRRQTINEKIEEALSAEAESRVQVGVDAAIVPQAAVQVEGEDTEANGRVYQLASADLFFTPASRSTRCFSLTSWA